MVFLLDLPRELSLQIVRLLDLGDKVNLSAICKRYRAQLFPDIFNTIRITTNDISATSALIAVQAYGQYVKTV